MKIREEFWDLIVSGEKTIELRTPSKLNAILDTYQAYNNKGKHYAMKKGIIDIQTFVVDSTGREVSIGGEQILKWYKTWVLFKGYTLVKSKYFIQLMNGEIRLAEQPLWWRENKMWILENRSFIENNLLIDKNVAIMFIDSWKSAAREEQENE